MLPFSACVSSAACLAYIHTFFRITEEPTYEILQPQHCLGQDTFGGGDKEKYAENAAFERRSTRERKRDCSLLFCREQQASAIAFNADMEATKLHDPFCFSAVYSAAAQDFIETFPGSSEYKRRGLAPKPSPTFFIFSGRHVAVLSPLVADTLFNK